MIPPSTSGPADLADLADLAAGLRSGAFSAAALAARALAAIAERDPGLGAFAAVDPRGAGEAARAADRELAAGLDRGPLHGVPVAVKDNIDVAGLPATMGSAHFAGHVPAADAACVRRLREAGAVIVGKTTTHEFAYGPTGDRSLQGPVRNPHDRERMTGGSSAGSAAAVAAGMVPLAIGTDTGGSVRIPAALCGVAGFKPAYGAIPADGVFPLSRSLDHVGVLAATAADCLVAYRALTGVPAPPGPAPTVVRVGWGVQGPGAPVAREVSALAREALDDPGVPEADLGFLDALLDDYSAIQGSEAYAVHAGRVAADPGRFQPEVLDRLKAAAATPGWRYVQAQEARREAVRRAAELFERFDVIATPTVGVVAPHLLRRRIDVDGAEVSVRDALLRLTSPWNMTGYPALTVPAGTVGGLPVGLQLASPPGREDLLFAVAARIAAVPADRPV